MSRIRFLQVWSMLGVLSVTAAALPARGEGDIVMPSDKQFWAEHPNKELTPVEQNLLDQWRHEPEVYQLSTFKEFVHEDSFQDQLAGEYRRSAEMAAVKPVVQVPAEITRFKAVAARAKAGDANAQLELGTLYDQGDGVNTDHEAAFRWWMKAAEQGLALAQNNVGAAYSSGLGVVRDRAQAFQWFHKAADQGSAPAMAELGWMYFSGNGVGKDKEMARQLWLKASPESPKAKFGLHVLSNTRLLSGDATNGITGCIMGISLDGTFPDQILYVGDDGVLCSQLKLADASRAIQEEYGYSPERAAAYHAERTSRQRAASQERLKELEAVLRRLTALRRERQIDDLNDNLRSLTQTLDQRNGVAPPIANPGLTAQELDQKIFDLQQSIDQMTEEPVSMK